MNVRQRIIIGSMRINSISNSSILQVGSSGLIQAYTKDTDEYYTVYESQTAGGGQSLPQMHEQTVPTEPASTKPTAP